MAKNTTQKIRTIINTTNLGDKGTWEGTVNSVRFLGKNDYAVIELMLNSNKIIVAEGKMQNPIKNARIKVTGEVVHNSTYNEDQIHVTSSDIKASPDVLACISFLTSNAIPGFSSVKRASDFIAAFGTDLENILTDEKKLITFPRISETSAKNIKSAFNENKHLLPLYFLTSGNISFNQAQAIYNKYREKAVDIVKRNPYRLIYDLDKFGFLTADKLALNVGFKYDTPERIFAALVHCVRTAASDEGHTYLPKTKLFETATEFIFSTKEMKNIFYQDIMGMKIVPNDTSDWDMTILCDMIKNHARRLSTILSQWGEDEARDKICKKEKFTSDEIDCIDIFYEKRRKFNDLLEDCLKKNSLDVSNMTAEESVTELNKIEHVNKQLIIMTGAYNEAAIITRDNYLMECNIAEIIVNMLKSGVVRESTNLNILTAIKYIEAIESQKKGFNYILDADQKEAVDMVINNRFSIITGGPGRGKTTIIKTAIKAWEGTTNKAAKGDPRVILLAPTGKAAKRMTESTGYPATTIHRFLMTGASEVLDKNTLLIVDESSMIDLSLFNWLLSKSKNAQIALVGDIDQLPSVGPGQILEDLIKSGQIPCTYLQTCHRNDGAILYNSTVINSGGQLQQLVNDNTFATRWYNDNPTVIKILSAIYKKMIDSNKYQPKDMMVLTPMNIKTGTSVLVLNKILQEIANPKAYNKREETINLSSDTNYVLREGDRVFQTKNDYNREVTLSDGTQALGVFNGDTGTLIKYIVKDNKTHAVIEFDDGKTAYYPLKDLYQLKLSYALNYYKSQGSEYKFIICVLMKSDYVLLNRKMLYTGETRAQEMCLFIGQPGAFQLAISNKYGESTRRYTTLGKRIADFKNSPKL